MNEVKKPKRKVPNIRQAGLRREIEHLQRKTDNIGYTVKRIKEVDLLRLYGLTGFSLVLVLAILFYVLSKVQ